MTLRQVARPARYTKWHRCGRRGTLVRPRRQGRRYGRSARRLETDQRFRDTALGFAVIVEDAVSIAVDGLYNAGVPRGAASPACLDSVANHERSFSELRRVVRAPAVIAAPPRFVGAPPCQGNEASPSRAAGVNGAAAARQARNEPPPRLILGTTPRQPFSRRVECRAARRPTPFSTTKPLVRRRGASVHVIGNLLVNVNALLHRMCTERIPFAARRTREEAPGCCSRGSQAVLTHTHAAARDCIACRRCTDYAARHQSPRLKR